MHPEILQYWRIVMLQSYVLGQINDKEYEFAELSLDKGVDPLEVVKTLREIQLLPDTEEEQWS